MFRRAWKPLAATVVVGAPVAGYYYYNNQSQSSTFALPIRVRTPEGKSEMRDHAVPYLTPAQVEQRLHERESFKSHQRPGITWKHTTAQLSSNDPIEDAHSDAIIQRDPTDPAAPGDYLFFGVFDGHSGFQTSQLLSKVLVNAVVLELSSLTRRSDPAAQKSGGSGWSLWSPTKAADKALYDGNPEHVSTAIQNAFTKLDYELINAPLRILANNLDAESKKNKTIPDLSKHPLALTSMLPAISGSCALMAVFDVAQRDLYVSCTGDCRAVAGIWQENQDGTGSWKCDVLSEDQTGRNPKELKRMQSEHPKEEADTVIMNGRVLGGLEPTRAFGDARYKWPRVIQETLNQAFMQGNDQPLRPPPKLFQSPPYVTATPVVTHRKLSLPPAVPSVSSDESSPTSSKESFKFVVLATDGLFDQLSSEEVVSLVGGHLAGLKGTIPKSQLSKHVPLAQGGSATVEGKGEGRRQVDSTGSWAFVDDNVSTHLIRNAMGGGDEPAVRRLLSIPAPYSRRYRDDVTVTVVWWEDGANGAPNVSQIQAKL